VRQLGLVQRRFDTASAFLDFANSRTWLFVGYGGAAFAVGALLMAAAPHSRLESLFVFIAVGGLCFVVGGVANRGWVAKAREASQTAPQERQFSTFASAGVRGTIGLKGMIVDAESGYGALVTVYWGSFGAEQLRGTAAQVFGTLSKRKIVLITCEDGYALGKISRTQRFPTAATIARRGHSFETFS
jgi:hypothetical protein